ATNRVYRASALSFLPNYRLSFRDKRLDQLTRRQIAYKRRSLTCPDRHKGGARFLIWQPPKRAENAPLQRKIQWLRDRFGRHRSISSIVPGGVVLANCRPIASSGSARFLLSACN